MRVFLLISSLIIIGFSVWAWLHIDWAIDTRREHAPEPDSMIFIGEHVMKAEAFMLQHAYSRQRIGSVKHAFLSRRNLFPFLYIISGLAGACISIWLLLVKEQLDHKGRNWTQIAASILLSGVGGLIAYLLIKLSFLSIGRQNPLDAFDSWAVLAVLAGAFNTTFYDALPDVLKGLLAWLKKLITPTGVPFVLVLLLLAFMTPFAGLAQSTEAGAKEEDRYFKCIEPRSSRKCRAFTDEEKAACSQCATWESVYLRRDIFAALKELDEAYPNQAGRFLIESTSKIHNVAFTFEPVSAAMIYADPEQFGFEEISANEAEPGALVVYPNLGGVVANEAGDIAYPSAMLDGTINVVREEILDFAGKARYLVPANLSNRDPDARSNAVDQ